MQKIKVWDLPVRICHWLLVLIIVFQYLSAEVLSDDVLANPLKWHFIAGYTCIGIIIFRLCWGVLGSVHARFINFVPSPANFFKYFSQSNENQSHAYLGHNPAGAYSVIVLLSLILGQALSGLFISDEIFNDGPYYGLLSSQWQSVMNFLHHNVYIVLYSMIALHIMAIVYHKVKLKHNLTKAMITGYKEIDANGSSKAQETFSTAEIKLTHTQSFPWLGFIISVAVSVVAVYLLVEVLPPPPSEDFYM